MPSDLLIPVPLLVAVCLLLCTLAVAAPPLPDTVEPYPVVGDIAFAEGPIFDRAGNLYFVNYHVLGTMGRRTPDGTVSVWIHTGGQANGSKVDGAGNVVLADYGGKRILRVHPITRAIEVLTSECEGRAYRGPNDVCLDLKGNIFFTDPEGSDKENPIGCVYRIAIGPGNAVRKVTRIAERLAFPNGLAVSLDQSKLYVAESGTNRLLCWDLSPDGTLSNKRTIIEFPNDTLDGIMFDEFGRLWIARWTNKTVDVVDVEKGTLLKSYPAGGDQVSNLCWWGTSLYVTVAGQHSIHRMDVGVRGAEIIPKGE
ncbi:MAG: SMP-30/gluconolactonase/LRE family protein [Armatimonadota bacterium]|jgi:sugar lactone lactonase YvrE